MKQMKMKRFIVFFVSDKYACTSQKQVCVCCFVTVQELNEGFYNPSHVCDYSCADQTDELGRTEDLEINHPVAVK